MGIIILAVIAYLLYANWKKKQEQGGGNNLPQGGNQQSINQQSNQQQQQTVQCPQCGGENKAGNYFCEHCGKKI